MEIRNASAPPSKSNQLRNLNTIRLKSRNINTQSGEIDDRKSEVIAFENAGMNIIANNFYTKNQRKKFLCLKYSFSSTEVPLDISVPF